MVVQTEMKFTPTLAKDLLDELLQAETEEQVHNLLVEYGLLRDSSWLAYGRVANNSGPFFSQSSSPEGALVEKIVNGIDAVFMAKAYEHGDFASNPPRNMFEAAERYFGIPKGDIYKLKPAGKRREIARNSVQVVFSGNRSLEGSPTITITDQGEGQDPDNFPETFLSLLKDNKLRVPFVQGKFNMGSTGTIPFCGEKYGYQLILSRRHPSAPGHGDYWGYTIVRRRRPSGGMRASQFQYLAPQGDILTVDIDALPIWVMADGTLQDIRYGSLVRLFEYKIKQKSNAKLNFSRTLNRRLYKIPIPVQVIERRYKAARLEEIIAGMETRLTEDTTDVEQGYPYKDEFNIPEIGKVKITLVPFKENEDTYVRNWITAKESVIFTVNGQAHGFETRDYLRRKGKNGVDFYYLGQKLLVVVDCTALPEDMFMGSRDRLRECSETDAFLRELTYYLRHHIGLRELNNKRKKRAIQLSTKGSSKTQELFKRMVQSTPSLSSILNGTGSIPDPSRSDAGDGPQFLGRRFPTFLRWKKGGPFLMKHCPSNSYCILELETDAEDAFLSREVEPGECIIEPAEWVISRPLANGKLIVRMKPPEGTAVGSEHNLSVRLLSPDSWEPLNVDGRMIVDPPHKKKKNKPGSGPNPQKQKGVAAPEIHEVRKNSWHHHGFNTDSVAVLADGDETTEVFVNMDNRTLLNSCHSEPKRAEAIKEMYKLVSAAMAVALEGAVDKDGISREAVSKSFEAAGKVLAPSIDFVSQVAESL